MGGIKYHSKFCFVVIETIEDVCGICLIKCFEFFMGLSFIVAYCFRVPIKSCVTEYNNYMNLWLCMVLFIKTNKTGC